MSRAFIYPEGANIRYPLFPRLDGDAKVEASQVGDHRLLRLLVGHLRLFVIKQSNST